MYWPFKVNKVVPYSGFKPPFSLLASIFRDSTIWIFSIFNVPRKHNRNYSFCLYSQQFRQLFTMKSRDVFIQFNPSVFRKHIFTGLWYFTSYICPIHNIYRPINDLHIFMFGAWTWLIMLPLHWCFLAQKTFLKLKWENKIAAFSLATCICMLRYNNLLNSFILGLRNKSVTWSTDIKHVQCCWLSRCFVLSNSHRLFQKFPQRNLPPRTSVRF